MRRFGYTLEIPSLLSPPPPPPLHILGFYHYEFLPNFSTKPGLGVIYPNEITLILFNETKDQPRNSGLV